MCETGQVYTNESPDPNLPINPFSQSVPDARSMAMVGADPAAIASAEFAKTQLQLAYFMATQKPRDRRASWGKIMEACNRPAFAAKAIYNKPVGGGTITGASVRLAEEIITQWGNILARTQVIFEDDKMRRVTVQVIDLETNNQYIKEIVTNKTVERKFAGQDREIIGERKNTNGETVYIVKATEDELHNKESSAISKAIRNEGLRLIPADVVEDAVNTCLEVRGTADKVDPDKQLKTLIAWFTGIHVDVAALQEYLGHSLDTVAPTELESLRGIFRAISDGETTWNQVMEEKTANDPANVGKRQMETTADKIKADMEKAEEPAFDKKRAMDLDASLRCGREPAAVDGVGVVPEGESVGDPTGEHGPEPDDFDLMEMPALDNWLAAKKNDYGADTMTHRLIVSALKSDVVNTKRELARRIAND